MSFQLNNSRWLSLFVFLSFIIAVIIAGCGGKKEEKPEKIYKFPCSNKIKTLDPAHATNMSEESIISEIYNSLVSVNENFEITPELAESWEYDNQIATYTFHLRKGVKFHNGREMKANDVISSFSRLVNKKEKAVNYKWALWIKGSSSYREGSQEKIEGLRAIDDYTLEIELFQVYVPFLSLLTTDFFSVLPSDILEEYSSTGEFIPVGTGPFKFEKQEDENRVLLKSNTGYFEGKPLLDGIEYKYISDPKEMIASYKAGELHHVWVFPELAEKIVKDEEVIGKVVNYPVNAIYYYAFNLDKTTKFGGSRQDKQYLRQAINYAINRQEICEKIYEGRCTPCVSVVPQGMCGYTNPLADRLGFTYDTVKAGELLDESGFNRGSAKWQVSLFTTFESPNYEIASMVKENLSVFGMDVEIAGKDKENYLRAIKEGDPSFFSYEWYMRYPDLDDLFSQFHSENANGGVNVANMTRDYIDKIINETRITDDKTARMELYRRLEEQILFDSPWVFMFQLRNAIMVRSEVSGLSEQIGQFDFRDALSHVRMEKVDLVVKEEK
jgi:oligopeptide transport system substrate-binding protein